jgi:predicted transcriptional regulator YdeE
MGAPRLVETSGFTFVGVGVRTTNADEADPARARIGGLWQRFFADRIADKIPGRRADAPILAIYSDYESDENSEYSLSIGSEVAPGTAAPEGMVARAVPGGRYAVFGSEKGAIRQIVVGTWRRIWQVTRGGELAGRRTYSFDFERYDERSRDPQNAEIDIYIALT